MNTAAKNGRNRKDEHTMSNKMTALYARSAAKNPEHITQQMNDLVTFAHVNHFTNLCHFTDDGYSAMNYERPALTQMKDAMEAGVIGTIIVKDIDRIARNPVAFELFMTLVRKHNIRFMTITEKVDN